VENNVGPQLVQLEAIYEEETTKELVGRKRQTTI
jgi:hypothetical protein